MELADDHTFDSEWQEHVAEGDRHFHRGELELAQEAYERALAICEHPNIVYCLGEVQLYLHNPARAMKHFRRYLALMSEDAAA